MNTTLDRRLQFVISYHRAIVDQENKDRGAWSPRNGAEVHFREGIWSLD